MVPWKEAGGPSPESRLHRLLFAIIPNLSEPVSSTANWGSS